MACYSFNYFSWFESQIYPEYHTRTHKADRIFSSGVTKYWIIYFDSDCLVFYVFKIVLILIGIIFNRCITVYPLNSLPFCFISTQGSNLEATTIVNKLYCYFRSPVYGRWDWCYLSLNHSLNWISRRPIWNAHFFHILEILHLESCTNFSGCFQYK